MRFSNRHLRAIAAAAAVLPLPLAADDLWLNSGERLSGTVRSIRLDGAVTLDTPLSPEPIALKPGAIKRVIFSEPKDAVPPGDCLLGLTNGDALSGVLERIDERSVVLASGVAGRLEIPRAAVASLRPGLDHAKGVFSGPGALADWTRSGKNNENCTIEDGALRLRGAYLGAGRKLELPEQFSLRCKLSWNGEPNLKIAFAADNAQDIDPQDRYYLTFNAAGIEIKREIAGGGSRFQSMTTLARRPDQFPGKQVLIEVIVDRTTKRLHLFLNGESEGQFMDPMPKAPAGDWIAFFGSAANNSHCDVADIQVNEWNQSLRRDRGGERGDKSKDALVGTDGERFTGRLLGAAKADHGMVFSFRDESQDKPINVPAEAVTALYLAEDGKAGGGGNGPGLRLRGGGSLRVTGCVFTPDAVEASHPLLEKIRLSRAAVESLECAQPEPEGKKP